MPDGAKYTADQLQTIDLETVKTWIQAEIPDAFKPKTPKKK
jgi:hypothetical protein